MRVYISVVSHGHHKLINDLGCLSALSQHFDVVLKSNNSSDRFDNLVDNNNFHWINERYGRGFGENNNIVFEYCCSHLNMKAEDYFLILNPDVLIEYEEIYNLIKLMESDEVVFASINLFKDKDKRIYDNSIRTFPSFKQFVKSFLGFGNSSIIDKSGIINACIVDWASGAFQIIRTDHYAKIGGFDENYFMYCEDIDICYRSSKMGHPITFYPQIKALHMAKHANRKLFSKHFYWHVSSVIRFLLTKSGMTKTKSGISSFTIKK